VKLAVQRPGGVKLAAQRPIFHFSLSFNSGALVSASTLSSSSSQHGIFLVFVFSSQFFFILESVTLVSLGCFDVE
jgi:hypothetical protein